MSDLFYRNPRLLALTICLILVSGLSAYMVLPRIEDPQLTKRVGLVRTVFPGASAERVESLVTEKLEKSLDEVEEIKLVTSTSLSGISAMIVELHDWVYEPDEIWSRVRDKLSDVEPDLPVDAGRPQFEEAQMGAYGLIAALKWTGEGPPNFAIMGRLAEELQDVLQALPWTEQVDLFGERREEIVVEIRPDQLATLGLSVVQVADQLRASDAKVTAGQLRGDGGNFVFEVASELDSLERIRNTPVDSGQSGQTVLLTDIADVRKAIADPPENIAIVDGLPAVAVSALVEPSRRIDLWSKSANAALEEFSQTLPSGVELKAVFDQAGYVNVRLGGLLFNLLLGAMAVMLVVLALMGWQSALIVGVSLPLSALMVLTGMRLLGMPVHQMSVTGLIIALGLLIDNAIVMVDEVRSYVRDGLKPPAAISESVRHLAVPLFGSTLTTALAFAPVALMPGPGGEFVGAIAVSVILAISSSYFLAMTVVPTLTGLAQRVQLSTRGNQWWKDGLQNDRLRTRYISFLDFLFARPWLPIALGMILPAIGFIQGRTLKEQFFPPADRDQFQIELELPSHAAISQTKQAAMQVRDVVMAHDRVQNVQWFIGESAPSFYYNLVERNKFTPQYAQGIVQLDSPEGVEPLIRKLQKELDEKYAGMTVLVRKLEQGPPFDAPVELRLYGADLGQLRELSVAARKELAAVPGVVHVRDDLSETLPKLALRVDEEEARMAGLDHLSISRQLDSTLEGATGGSLLEATEELPLRVRLVQSNRGDLDRVASLELVSSLPGRDSFVPLSTVANIELIPEQGTITRRNGRRNVTIQAYLTPGVLPSEVLGAFRERLDASKFELPVGYSLDVGGEAEARDNAVGNLLSTVGVLLVLMAATLVLSFGSFRAASIIALVGVMSVGLGLAALWTFGFPFGFMSIIGTMGLVGVAINDAIVVLAAARGDEKAAKGDAIALRNVVVKATRHVLSTTITTIAGFTPLLIAGGQFWPPLAVAIAGGVSGATVLALLFVPSLHLVLVRMFQGLTEQAAGANDRGLSSDWEQAPMAAEVVS